MAEETKDKLLFLTGHLAENRLKTVMRWVGLEEGGWAVRNIGLTAPSALVACAQELRQQSRKKQDRT